MYTTYHFNSTAEINGEILEAIKNTFKEKPIVITVEEELDATDYLMSTPANRAKLKKSLEEAKKGNFIEVKMDEL